MADNSPRVAPGPPPAPATAHRRPTAADALFLQRVSGSRAVQALLRPAPVPCGLVQRLAVKVQEQSGVISSVSFPDTSGEHKGDHTTAYTTFLSMVRNQLMGQHVMKVKAILQELINNIRGLPGLQKASANYLTKYLDTELTPAERRRQAAPEPKARRKRRQGSRSDVGAICPCPG